jgi:hypothetical protein
LNLRKTFITFFCFLRKKKQIYHFLFVMTTPIQTESGRERILRSLLRGKRANGEHYYSLWIEDSQQFTADSFN